MYVYNYIHKYNYLCVRVHLFVHDDVQNFENGATVGIHQPAILGRQVTGEEREVPVLSGGGH